MERMVGGQNEEFWSRGKANPEVDWAQKKGGG